METIKRELETRNEIAIGLEEQREGEKSLYFDNLIYIISLNTTSQELGIILFLFLYEKSSVFFFYMYYILELRVILY